MKRKLACLVLFSIVVAGAAVHFTKTVGATPAAGFSAVTLVKGTFSDIDVFNKAVIPSSTGAEHEAKVWLSLQKTKGSSDVYVQSNTWQPGATTGWHSHPGHSLIIVTSGTVTEYEGNDPDCKPRVYSSGMTFVDPGGDHSHILRNEGTVAATSIAVQLIPAGAARRIDVADPGNCHF